MTLDKICGIQNINLKNISKTNKITMDDMLFKENNIDLKLFDSIYYSYINNNELNNQSATNIFLMYLWLLYNKDTYNADEYINKYNYDIIYFLSNVDKTILSNLKFEVFKTLYDELYMAPLRYSNTDLHIEVYKQVLFDTLLNCELSTCCLSYMLKHSDVFISKKQLLNICHQTHMTKQVFLNLNTKMIMNFLYNDNRFTHDILLACIDYLPKCLIRKYIDNHDKIYKLKEIYYFLKKHYVDNNFVYEYIDKRCKVIKVLYDLQKW